MRLFHFVCWLVASLMIISLAPSAVAQQDQDFETGLNPYRTYQAGNIDSINMLNHGLNVDIPLISYPQRGGKLSLAFDLHYTNQGNWYNCSPGTNCSGFYGSGPFLTNGFGVILKNWPSIWGATCQSLGDSYGTWTCQGSATMSDGSNHSMYPITPTSWDSNDTSGLQIDGFTLNATNNPPLLIDANGTRYSQTYTPSLFPGPVGGEYTLSYVPTLVEDTNGNEISYSQTAGWTDTMGRQIPLPVSASTSVCPQTPLVPSSAYTWNLPGVNGGNYNLTFCYVPVPVTLNWDHQILNQSETELQSVLLPDGTSWTFRYTTDGNGDLSQITFPTGGTLSYTWRTESPICSYYIYNNARQIVTRTLNPNDGVGSSSTWNYGYISNIVGLVTDPASNDTVHTFSSLVSNTCPYYETKAQYYQGSHTGGTLLKTVSNQYQALSTYSYLTTLGQPSQTQTLWANNQENETSYAYDNALTFHTPYWASSTQFSTHYGTTYSGSYGLLETKRNYDYGNGAPGTLLRTTSTSYEALSNSGYLNNNLLTLRAGVSVTGSGPGSITSYAYDQTTPVVSGITTQHDSNPPAGTYRGNPTAVSRYLNTTGTYLSTTLTNFDTGMVDVVKDPIGNQTQYGYSGTYAGAFLTSVANALNQTTAFAYDFNTGLPTSTTDPNNQTTSYGYDNMLRTTQINYPDSGQTTLVYWAPSGGVITQITEKMNSSGGTRVSYVFVDGLGREGRVAVTNSETLPYDETVDICYDGLGRVSFQGYPFQDSGWSAPRSCSIAGDSFTYDALSRSTKVTHSDNSFISTSYSGNSTTVTDEASKTRESFTDGLGRMTEVIENPGGLNYITNYIYDVLDNLTGVVQSGSRNRSFVYDSLSRLTSSTNPESGTQSFGYDADSNLKTRVAPAPNQTGTGTVTTTYSYDALNRLTQKSYSDGSTPSVFFGYDANFWWNVTLTNTIGRLMTQWVGTPCCVTTGEEIFSYDPMGRILLNTQYVQSTQTFTQMTYTYDLVGDMLTATKQGGYTTSYQYNSAGRPTTMTSSLVDAQHPATLASGVHYAANGAMTQLTYGNGLTESTVYNPRFQPCRNNVNSSGTVFNNVSACGSTSMPTGNVLDLQYNWNPGSGDNGNLAGTTVAGAQTYSRTYSYDQLNRLSSMSGTGGLCTGLNWSYDAWGNRTSQTQVSGTCYQQPTTTITSKNQFSGYGYDAAGNMTSQSGATYAYDAENRLTSTSGGSASYLYDATGRRVTKTVSGAYRNYLYDLNRNVISEATSAGWATGYVYLNGRPIAEYANATTYFITGDQLGSSRLLTNLSKGVQDCNGLYPYGEQDPGICTSTNTTPHKFTSYERDAESGLDNAQARYYGSSLGRFMSPDPSGILMVGAGNPQGLNLYSYVQDNPINATDPDGLDCVYINDNSVTVLRGDCASVTDRGIYFPGSINIDSLAYDRETHTLGFNYTNDDTGALGSGVIAGVLSTRGANDADRINAVAQGTQMAGYFLSTPKRWYDAEQAWANRHPNIVAIVGIVGGLLAGGEEPMEEAPTGESPFGNTPEGRPLSQHYATETGPARNIPGSVVDETINHPTHTQQLGDRTVYYSADNNVTVVVSNTTGKIMSARKGTP